MFSAPLCSATGRVSAATHLLDSVFSSFLIRSWMNTVKVSRLVSACTCPPRAAGPVLTRSSITPSVSAVFLWPRARRGWPDLEVPNVSALHFETTVQRGLPARVVDLVVIIAAIFSACHMPSGSRCAFACRLCVVRPRGKETGAHGASMTCRGSQSVMLTKVRFKSGSV